jgi:hypothetical protein
VTKTSRGESLRPLLQTLVDQIRRDVQEWRGSGQLVMSRREYSVRPDHTLQYSVDRSMINDVPLEHGEEEVWDRANQHQFFQEKIGTSAVYKQLLGETSGIMEGNECVVGFAREIAIDSLLPPVESKAEQHLDTVISDLSGAIRNYVARLWLTGIRPQEDLIQVSERLLIRKPEHADMQERVSDESVRFGHAFPQQTWFACIGELQVPVHHQFEVPTEVDRLVSALRLFRLGSVSASRIDTSVRSFTGFSNTRFGGSSLPAVRIEYELSESDVPEFSHFLQVMTPAMPTPYGFPPQEPDFLTTAFDWYADGLLAPKPVQGTIASVVACLEALFLSDTSDSGELTFRLVQRTALLLASPYYS